MNSKKPPPKLGVSLKKAMLSDRFLGDIHDYRIDRHNFTIYVGGDPRLTIEVAGSGDNPFVDYNMADRFELNLEILSRIDPVRPILVKLACIGGNMEEGLQMLSAILYAPNPITVLAVRDAPSIGSLIPLAADRFIIRPPARYMIHRGTYGFSGSDQEAATEEIERRKAQALMFRLYTARLQEQGRYQGRPAVHIQKALNDKIRRHTDVWFSADEAKEWGFVDEVLAGTTETLCVAKKNLARRKSMLAALRTPASSK